MRFVTVKSQAHQDMLALHRVRSLGLRADGVDELDARPAGQVWERGCIARNFVPHSTVDSRRTRPEWQTPLMADLTHIDWVSRQRIKRPRENA